MTNSQRLAAVRLRLNQWLVQNADSHADDVQAEAAPKIRGESILIREGFYCGRQFDAGEYRAVWFMEEDELKISTRDGKWVCSLQADELVPDLVPGEVQAMDVSDVKEDVEVVQRQELMTIPLSQRTPDSDTSAESFEDLGSDEQEIRRAA